MKWLVLLIGFSGVGLLSLWMVLTPSVRERVLGDESTWVVALVVVNLGVVVVLCGSVAYTLLPVVIDPSRLSLRVTEQGIRFTRIFGQPEFCR